MKQYDSIIGKISTLSELPERCHLLKDNNLRLKGYRCLKANHYSVFFTIKDQTVQIRRILYNKRNYEWLL
jgi:toxin ParE1/3/4